MIDLKKLEEKLDAALNKETAESLNAWLDDVVEREKRALQESGHSTEFEFVKESINVADKSISFVIKEYNYGSAA